MIRRKRMAAMTIHTCQLTRTWITPNVHDCMLLVDNGILSTHVGCDEGLHNPARQSHFSHLWRRIRTTWLRGHEKSLSRLHHQHSQQTSYRRQNLCLQCKKLYQHEHLYPYLRGNNNNNINNHNLRRSSICRRMSRGPVQPGRRRRCISTANVSGGVSSGLAASGSAPDSVGAVAQSVTGVNEGALTIHAGWGRGGAKMSRMTAMRTRLVLVARTMTITPE